jgi:hypothetical protein
LGGIAVAILPRMDAKNRNRGYSPPALPVSRAAGLFILMLFYLAPALSSADNFVADDPSAPAPGAGAQAPVASAQRVATATASWLDFILGREAKLQKQYAYAQRLRREDDAAQSKPYGTPEEGRKMMEAMLKERQMQETAAVIAREMGLLQKRVDGLIAFAKKHNLSAEAIVSANSFDATDHPWIKAMLEGQGLNEILRLRSSASGALPGPDGPIASVRKIAPGAISEGLIAREAKIAPADGNAEDAGVALARGDAVNIVTVHGETVAGELVGQVQAPDARLILKKSGGGLVAVTHTAIAQIRRRRASGSSALAIDVRPPNDYVLQAALKSPGSVTDVVQPYAPTIQAEAPLSAGMNPSSTNMSHLFDHGNNMIVSGFSAVTGAAP